MKADQLLSKAAQHMRDRAATYDKPDGERSMGKAVQAFNAITGRDLTEPEGWLLLQVLKDVRLFQRPGYHADSAEDCIAYAALKAEAKAAKWMGAPVALQSVADIRGWIQWSGGDSPVPGDVTVKYIIRSGVESQEPARKLLWDHGHGTADIIAYRIVS